MIIHVSHASTPSGLVNPKRRRGTALVEFAVILPLLFMLILGIIEVGRALMVQQILVNGVREGARTAVLPSATDTEVYDTIDTYLSATGIRGHTSQVSPSLAGIAPNTPITVTVSVPYSSVTWLPSGAVQWFSDQTLTASVVMRKEP